MEHASGGEMYDYINDNMGLYNDEAQKFFRQIVSAVKYLHDVSRSLWLLHKPLPTPAKYPLRSVFASSVGTFI